LNFAVELEVPAACQSPRQRAGEQLALARYTGVGGRHRIGWVEARRLADGAPRLVPAAAVFMSRAWWPDEPRFCALVSHGLAAHRSAAAATDHAILEVYERHRMTVAWHRQDFGVALDPRGLGDGGAALAERARAAGLTLTLHALAVPPEMPVVVALLAGDRPPFFMIGAAARTDVAAAASAALLEAASGWQALERHPDRPGRRQLRAREDASGHRRYYAGRARAVVDALARGTRPAAAWPAGRSQLAPRALALRLAPEAVVVGIETPDCAAAGFHVARVILPGLPLYQFGRVGTPGLHAAAAGLPEARAPHPFS